MVWRVTAHCGISQCIYRNASCVWKWAAVEEQECPEELGWSAAEWSGMEWSNAVGERHGGSQASCIARTLVWCMVK